MLSVLRCGEVSNSKTRNLDNDVDCLPNNSPRWQGRYIKPCSIVSASLDKCVSVCHHKIDRVNYEDDRFLVEDRPVC